jgi:geranylgeranyl transferase type-1 subunit beta
MRQAPDRRNENSKIVAFPIVNSPSPVLLNEVSGPSTILAYIHEMTSSEPPPFDKARHIKYWQRCHHSLIPHRYTSQDGTRVALAFFTIASLDLLSVQTSDPASPILGKPLLDAADRRQIRSWVLALQHPGGGFCGSPNLMLGKNTFDRDGTNTQPGESPSAPSPGQAASANIAATSFALLLLALAAEDESSADGAYVGVDRARTLAWLRRLQRPDGSFGEVVTDDGHTMGGRDMRYCYLAASIRWCLRGAPNKGSETWVEDIDVDGLVKHIQGGQVRLSRQSTRLSNLLAVL